MQKPVILLELESNKADSPRDLPNRRTQTGSMILEWRHGRGRRAQTWNGTQPWKVSMTWERGTKMGDLVRSSEG